MRTCSSCLCLGSAPCILLLLVCCSTQDCLAFRHTIQSLNEVTVEFSNARRDTVQLLPMVLELRIKSCTNCDFSHVVNLLMKVIQKRHKFIQLTFHDNYPTEGYMLSTAKRFKVEGDKFFMYYYIAFLGTSNLNILSYHINTICLKAIVANKTLQGPACNVLMAHKSAVLYNLILLSTFKFVPTGIPELSSIFYDFKPGSGFLTARSSEEHDIHELLCKTYLQCYPSVCRISKISVPESVTNRTEWPLYDKYLNASQLVGSEVASNDSSVNTSDLVNLSVDQVYQAVYLESKQDFGIYRSWCETSVALRYAADSLVTLIPPLLLMLWLLCCELM